MPPSAVTNPFEIDRLSAPADFRPEWDVPSINQGIWESLQKAVLQLSKADRPDPRRRIPVLLGEAGYGKTHLFGRLRQLQQSIFIAVPQIEETGEPVRHIHWHVVEGLFKISEGRPSGMARIIAHLCRDSFGRYLDDLPHTLAEPHRELRRRLRGDTRAVFEIVAEVKGPSPYLRLADSITNRLPNAPADIVRAMVLSLSPAAHAARRWLRGEGLDGAEATALGLGDQSPSTTRLLDTIARLSQLVRRPVIICCDQAEGYSLKPEWCKELTLSLVNWIENIPNLMVILSCLRNQWEALQGNAHKMFPDRARSLQLETLTGEQAVELIRRRLDGWEGRPSDKGGVWPFWAEDITRYVEKDAPGPRQFIKVCAARLNAWSAKRSGEIKLDGGGGPVDYSSLFRQEWEQTLASVQEEKLSPDDTQEERLFRAVREALQLFQQSRTSAGGLELLQLADGAIKRGANDDRPSVQLKAGVGSSPAALTLVVGVTKHTGGLAFGAYLNALEAAIEPPVAGAVLVRPTAELKFTGKAAAKEKFEKLRKEARLRPFALSEHPNTFEHLESWLRMLDKAGRQDLQLAGQTIAPEQCRKLAVETKLLAGLDLYETVFAGWPQVTRVSPVPAAPGSGGPPAPEPKGPQAASVSAAQAAASVGTAPAQPAGRRPVDTAPIPPPPPPADDWADDLLHKVADKLKTWGQPVEALRVQIGPTFARLMLRPLGQTSVGKVRNRAADLKTHIVGIEGVPLVGDQPGYISVDVLRPDRQAVRLADCLLKPPAKLAGLPAFPVGADVAAQPHWLNLADPSTCHLLVAGTTGSGKSEFLKALMAGLAARLSPFELQFVLVDPKRVTFNFPGGSPYLRSPVARTIDDALPLVDECFAEVEARYTRLAAQKLEHVGQLSGRDALPRIVVIFDEFADLMADKAAAKKLELPLKRIGGMARAAGVHLVLATQRPDQTVVTPILRANLPTRICLRVDGERNSMLVLDENGGQHLFGRGDLLWKFGGGMMRLQSPLVEKAELEQLLRM